MKKLLARFVRQSPAMIVALLALFVAMGGTAIAASSALITGKQIANSSITGADVKNKSLTPKDFKGSVRGPRGPAGATGATGAKGDKGDPGAPNPNAVDSQNLGGHPASSYVLNSGLTLFTVGTSEWQPGANPPAGLDVDRYSGVLYATTTGAALSTFFNVSPTVPTSVYGKAFQLEGVELCYDASATAVLNDVFLGVHRDGAGPNDNPYLVMQQDATDRTDRMCRVYNLPTPHVLTTDDWVQLAISVNYTAAATFQIGRTTFILRPTATAAAAPASVTTTLKPVASQSVTAGSHQ